MTLVPVRQEGNSDTFATRAARLLPVPHQDAKEVIVIEEKEYAEKDARKSRFTPELALDYESLQEIFRVLGRPTTFYTFLTFAEGTSFQDLLKRYREVGNRSYYGILWQFKKLVSTGLLRKSGRGSYELSSLGTYTYSILKTALESGRSGKR